MKTTTDFPKPLPDWWEQRLAPNGRFYFFFSFFLLPFFQYFSILPRAYFVDHNTKTTQWTDPRETPVANPRSIPVANGFSSPSSLLFFSLVLNLLLLLLWLVG
jgi:hypothetical protein